MKFGVVIFPGSNCDKDVIHVCGNVLGKEVLELWHKDQDLKGLKPEEDVIILPGGFSYGDYLRSGAIARFSPVMEEVIAFAHSGGCVIGICNGFQILCESGLLPGALLKNDNQLFSCKNVFIRVDSANSAMTTGLKERSVLKIPIAHSEGRFFADDATLAALEKNDQILFRYVDAAGEANAAGNPNGSCLNIAGICNENRNVIGMMPHPERAAEEALGNKDGLLLLNAILESKASSPLNVA